MKLLPLPFESDMEDVEPSQEAKYFADQIGAFEVHYETGQSGNKVRECSRSLWVFFPRVSAAAAQCVRWCPRFQSDGAIMGATAP